MLPVPLPRMAPLRVLHLARVINRHDFIDTVVRYLPKERFSIEVATFQPMANIEEPRYEEVGIPHHIVSVPHMRAYPRYVIAAFQLANLLRKRKIALLHTHHFWEGVVGAIAKKLYPAVRFALHRHYTEDIFRLNGIKKALMLRLESMSYKQADRVIVPTETMRNFLKRQYQNRQLPAIEVIPYGFAFEAHKYCPLALAEIEAIRRTYGVSPDSIIIANIGSHRYQKGQVELLKAFSRLSEDFPQVYLWLIGEGPQTSLLREMVASLSLGEKCIFWGWKKASEVRELMGAADIVAHPTYSEAFPQVMVEALVLGRALVITPVSGAREWLRHGEHAWVIPIGDEEALYMGLRKLIEEPGLRERLGRQGADHLRAHLAYQAINPQYEALYTELCSR